MWEILHETMLRGKASAAPALQVALSELESHLGWTRTRRQQIVLRLDGGFGTTDQTPPRHPGSSALLVKQD
jgi:hypothetical protein